MQTIFDVRAPIPDFGSRSNMAPTRKAAVVRDRGGRRELSYLCWGFIPQNVRDSKIGYGMINAHVETVDREPAFRDAWRERRCLIPAHAFFEWLPRCKRAKRRWRIGMKSGAFFGMAGLWESWQHEGETVDSFTIIVGPPNELVQPIHSRMPAIVRPENYDAWLNSSAGKEVLAPYPAEAMMVEPIFPAIGSAKYDISRWVEPAAAWENK